MAQGSRRYYYAAQFGTDVDVLLHDVRGMLLDGRNILTAEVGAFENAFAACTQTSFARGVNSGTDAIIGAPTTH
jgi:dTDP-4-amino-4,6-dideoxygalactose transaminase